MEGSSLHCVNGKQKQEKHKGIQSTKWKMVWIERRTKTEHKKKNAKSSVWLVKWNEIHYDVTIDR